MNFLLSILFFAENSVGVPAGFGLSRDMNTGHPLNTLATNQKQTDMKITREVMPRIEHNYNMLKKSIEREYNETSQLYAYIDASISHVTKAIFKTITDMKNNTEENLDALEKNMKENLVSLRTINSENNKKIVERTVNSDKSALALSLDWMSRRMKAAEVKV